MITFSDSNPSSGSRDISLTDTRDRLRFVMEVGRRQAKSLTKRRRERALLHASGPAARHLTIGTTCTRLLGQRMDPGALPGRLRRSSGSVRSVQLSAGCQRVQLPGKQLHRLPTMKYAFKMSPAPERAGAEATNRFALVVQLTLA